MKKRYVFFIIITLVFSAIVFAAVSCGRKNNGVEGMKMREIRSETAPTANDEAKSADLAKENVPRQAQPARKVIMNGTLTIEVKFLDATDKDIVDAAKSAGGYISNSTFGTDSEGVKSGTISIRVPVKSFEDVFCRIKKFGNVKSASITGEDVTEEYIDTAARLNNMRAEEQRYLDILKRAGTIEDVLKVEQEISRIRGEIESLTGRLKFMDNRVEYATITVNLKEVTHPSLSSIKMSTWNLRETLLNADNAFLNTIRVLAVILIWLLVFSPIVIVPLLIIVLVRRLKKKRKLSA